MPRLARIESEVLKLRKEVDRIEPINGIGINVADSPTGKGRSINFIGEPGSGGASTRLPLEPYEDSDETDLRVSITYGTVGGLPIDDYGPVTITATRYFFAKLTVDGDGEPTTLELIDQASITTTDTDTVYYVYLGRAVVADDAITEVNRNLTGSQGYERCGFTGQYSHTSWVI